MGIHPESEIQKTECPNGLKTERNEKRVHWTQEEMKENKNYLISEE